MRETSLAGCSDNLNTSLAKTALITQNNAKVW